MAILRYANQTNPNPAGAAGLTSAIIVQGVDYTLKVINRVLASSDNNNHGDIGTGVGQTRDNAGGGAPGCLVAQFQGAIIKDVVSFSVFRPAVAGGRTFYQRLDGILDGQAGHQSLYEWTLSTDRQSLYVYDLSANAASFLAGGDMLKFLVVLGNQ
jgi:hypothetical protein